MFHSTWKCVWGAGVSRNIRRVLVSGFFLLVLSGVSFAEQPEPGPTVVRAGQVSRISVDGEAPFHSTEAAVGQTRLIRLPSTGTRIALWNEGSDGDVHPHYAIGKSGAPMGPPRATSYVL